jgi:hypothetical protein
MGEKASVFQTTQIGIETTAGSAVAANRKLAATSIIPGPRLEADAFRAQGNKYPSFVTPNKEWSEFSIEGKNTYNEVTYLLSSLIAAPTPTQGGTTSAYTWIFTSDTDGEDAGKTFTIEQGDANSMWAVAGARVSGLTFTFNRSEVSISGSGYGEPFDTSGTALTASPTTLDALPILPTHLKFYMADTRAGLTGATAMTRGFSLIWSLTDKVGLAWPVGQDPVMVELAPSITATLRVATDTTGLGLIANMRAGSTKWFRVKAEGAVIAGSAAKNTFQLDFPAQIMGVSDPSDEEGISVLEYEMSGVHDATWGKAFEITLINSLSTL